MFARIESNNKNKYIRQHSGSKVYLETAISGALRFLPSLLIGWVSKCDILAPDFLLGTVCRIQRPLQNQYPPHCD